MNPNPNCSSEPNSIQDQAKLRPLPPFSLGRVVRAFFAIFAILAIATGNGRADTLSSGSLSMEVITAYNFVVDSNIGTPAGRSPSGAHLAVRICNNSATTTLTDIYINIGTLTDASTSAGTPGTFPSRAVTVTGSGAYSGTFSLVMPGGSADATRYIPSLAPGACVVQYFFVTYPLVDSLNRAVTGEAPVVSDDLWLNYDIWAKATEVATTRRVDQRTKVTMRNEISASANKIYPNTTSKVPSAYLDAIAEALGWRPLPGVTRVSGAIGTEGIWYDLGNVGAGFDNNGDLLPDRNAWLQPVGNPATFDPLSARLVKCYGLVIVKLNDGTEQLIPFEDQLYFEHVKENNTGAVGLVFYEFMPLTAGNTLTISPYQEVASGYDNEKFNSDYGSGAATFNTTAPSATINKTGPASVAAGGTVSYTLVSTNTGSVSIGNPGLGLPFIIEDSIPSGLVYVAGSATSGNSVSPSGPVLTVSWSADNGATWVTTEPTASTVTRIRWTLAAVAFPAGSKITAAFQCTVPSGYSSATIVNTGIIKLGPVGELARSSVTTLLTGNNSIGDLVWKDENRDGLQNDGAGTGIANIGVNLYYDANGNGVIDTGDYLYASTTTSSSTPPTGNYLFSSLPDGKYVVSVDYLDADLPAGYTLTNSAPTFYAVSLDPTHASSSAVNSLTNDWAFIPALNINKRISPTTYTVGNLLTYSIDLENWSLPVTALPNTVQTAYPASVAANRSVQNPAKAQGSPDGLYARLDYRQNSDTLTTAASTYTFSDQTVIPTKVELVLRGFLEGLMTDDKMDINYSENGATPGTLFTTVSTATMNTLVGAPQDFVVDISSIHTGAWTWSLVNGLRLQLKANKSGANDQKTYWVDSMALRVTTSAVNPVGTYGSTTINPFPVTDTYESSKLSFVSASVPPTSVSGGVITWANLGPVNAGARKTITVTFMALQPPNSDADTDPDPTTTLNTAASSGALFVSGLPANSDTATATVTINQGGSIGDFVYWDVNANGAYNAGTDFPLQEVSITLTDSGGNIIGGALTDANGNYLFTGLADGTYTVSVDTASLPFSSPTQTADPDSTLDSIGTATINLNNSSSTDNDILTLDFGYDSNARSAISGYVFQDNNGNGVKDAGENFLAGVTVTLSGTASATTTTDANGFYSFNNLSTAGNYTVTVTQPANTTQTLDPDATVNNATTVAVTLGNYYPNKNFGYKPSGSFTIGDTLYRDWNGNGTQDAGDPGIANVNIFLYEDSNGDGVIDTVNDALIATQVTSSTGTIGTYQFTGLPAGNYIVKVDTSDTDFPTNLTQTQDFDGTLDGQAKVALSASLATVDFGYKSVPGTGSIGDTVFVDENGDGVYQSTESGLSGVPVKLYADVNGNGVIDTLTDGLISTTTTDSNGNYLFSSLPAGNYQVYVDPNGTGIPSDSYGYKYFQTTTDPHAVVGLTTGQSVLTADFGFVPPGSIGDFVFYDLNSNGTQDYNEPGISGVTLDLYLSSNLTTPIANATTSSTGFYVFPNLAAGNYAVQVRTATLPASVTQTSDPDGTTMDNTDSNIALSAGASYVGADFGYHPLGAIGDFVWLDLNGNHIQDSGEVGIAGVTITVTGASGPYTTTTDADGYWGLLVPNGSWTITASGTPLSGKTATYDADNPVTGANSSVAFTLTGGNINLGVGNLGLDFGYSMGGSLSISGTVLTADAGSLGTADVPASEIELSGITVYLYNSSNVFLGSTTTDSNGLYTFTGLPTGGYKVAIGTTSTALEHTTLTTLVGQGNNAAVTTISNSGTTVTQTIPSLTTSLTHVDFAFQSSVNYDFGDLPAIYEATSLAEDGARHIIPGGGATIWLGSNGPDAEIDGVPSGGAGSDDTSGTDDEDGVTATPSGWTNGTNGGSVQVTVHGSGWLVGWIDWNNDGTFLDSGDMVISQAVTTGTATYTFNVPSGTVTASPGQSWYGRFRLFTSQPPFPVFAYSGDTTDGEVEDYLFVKQPASIGGTLWADSNKTGTLDVTESGRFSGVTVQLWSAGPNGVNNQGSGDDVYFGSTTTSGTGDYNFTNVPAGAYYVYVPTPPPSAPISSLGTDFFDNREDDDDNGIQSVSGGPVHSPVITLSAGETDTTIDFGFYAGGPTAVTLGHFNAAWSNGNVALDWDTASEIGTLGFNVYRQGSDGSRVKANESLILAGNSSVGANYRLSDLGVSNPVGLSYLLEEIEESGRSIMYGPFNVKFLKTSDFAGTFSASQGFVARFVTNPATSYDLEASDTLAPGSWVRVGTVVSDADGNLTIGDPSATGASVRFYRLLER